MHFTKAGIMLIHKGRGMNMVFGDDFAAAKHRFPSSSTGCFLLNSHAIELKAGLNEHEKSVIWVQ
jgi:hypothetical protein